MRRVLVTGSSRGIGRAIAERLAQCGFSVTVHCRSSRAQADELAARIGAAVLQFDVADRAAARRALELDLEAHGAYYGVVCNAGVTRDNTFAALSDAEWDEVLDTSLDGFYNVVQPLIMPMVRAKQGGRIVTIASASGIMGNRGQVNYSAAKAGLIGATKALAVELASRGITVNSVAPGLIESEMTAAIPLGEALKMVPMNRIGKPAEVAAAVAFIMSEEAAYITRQVLSVNGGLA
jgi:3-oxoacyl-[acyl-carrier protein] reductase